MNKCACVDYMVRCYNLLTIENWQRKKVNAAKKKIRSNPHVHYEQIFVIYFAINYNFVLVAQYYGFIRFQTVIL